MQLVVEEQLSGTKLLNVFADVELTNTLINISNGVSLAVILRIVYNLKLTKSFLKDMIVLKHTNL